MELENANPNGCNVVINNLKSRLKSTILFFSKNIENWVK